MNRTTSEGVYSPYIFCIGPFQETANYRRAKAARETFKVKDALSCRLVMTVSPFQLEVLNQWSDIWRISRNEVLFQILKPQISAFVGAMEDSRDEMVVISKYNLNSEGSNPCFIPQQR